MRAIAEEYEGVQWVKVVTRVYDWRLRCQVLQPEWKWRAVRGPQGDPHAALGYVSEPATGIDKRKQESIDKLRAVLLVRGRCSARELACAAGLHIATVQTVLRLGPFAPAGKRPGVDATGRRRLDIVYELLGDEDGELEG